MENKGNAGMSEARARAQYRQAYFKYYAPTSWEFFKGNRDKATTLRRAWPTYMTEVFIKAMFAALSDELDS